MITDALKLGDEVEVINTVCRYYRKHGRIAHVASGARMVPYLIRFEDIDENIRFAPGELRRVEHG